VPLVAFTPTRARLVIEPGRETILVMQVVVAKGESLDLAIGGKLESMPGSLRIRERREGRGRNENMPVGTMVYANADEEAGRSAATFQINVALSAAKFDVLLRIAISGQLPSKFFVHAGERISPRETRGIGYAMRGGARAKFWDNKGYRTLPVTNFSVILPIAVPEAEAAPFRRHRALEQSLSANHQVGELADEFAVFRGETKNTLMAVVSVVAVIGLLLIFINLLLIIK